MSEALWQVVPYDVLPTLAALRDAVLEHSEKRAPKWKFRLAPDLVMELQPRPGPRTLFEGLVIRAEGVTPKVFGPRKTRQEFDPYLKLGFDVVTSHRGIEAPSPMHWLLHPRSAGWSRGTDRLAGMQGLMLLRERLIAVFGDASRFASLDTTGLLGGHCLICGKGLSDPVSMARLIGPECWGSSGPSIPWTIRAEQQAA